MAQLRYCIGGSLDGQTSDIEGPMLITRRSDERSIRYISRYPMRYEFNRQIEERYELRGYYQGMIPIVEFWVFTEMPAEDARRRAEELYDDAWQLAEAFHIAT